MSEPRVLAAILGAEWAITPEALQGILAVANRENESPEAVEARIGRPLENTHRAEMRGSVAVIPVVGPLFRRANMFTRVSGATSYDMVAQDLREALENPAAKSIVLNIDSPGGMASGVAELASHIYEARAKKTVIAYVGGTGASAAYWLASAATEIVAAKTAMLGSVGVVVGVGKGKGAEEIVSSQSPYKRIDPSTAEGRARVQALVDNLAAIFVDDVAKYRGASVAHVLANFGQGDVVLGGPAADAGMVDRIGTFEGLIAEANAKHTAPATSGTYDGKAERPALLTQIQADAVASVTVDAARVEATTAERIRVLGIIGHAEADGREALALKLAGMPAMTVEGAAEIMSATPKAAKTAVLSSEFDKMMAKLNPAIQADAPTDDEGADAAACVARMKALDERR